MRNAIQIAQSWIDSGKYVESAGPNRGPAVDALEREFGLIGQPWCGMYACGAGHEALKEGAQGDPWPMIAGSQALLAWFRERDLVSADPQDVLDWLGALAIRTDPGGLHGHVVMLAQRRVAAAKILAFYTCEGNTDKDGGRNGDRAWNHLRAVPLPGVWHYCRTDGLAGGDWWRKAA